MVGRVAVAQVFSWVLSRVEGHEWLIITGSLLDLLALLLQLLLITIGDRIRLTPFLPGLRASSTVTVMVLIYESVSSSPSVVIWLNSTVEHSSLLRMNPCSLLMTPVWVTLRLRLTSYASVTCPFITPCELMRDPLPPIHVLVFFICCYGNMC
jgi:hypothetical protein